MHQRGIAVFTVFLIIGSSIFSPNFLPHVSAVPPDLGILFASSTTDGSIVRIDLNTLATQVILTGQPSPEGGVCGPDGKVYFSLSGALGPTRQIVRFNQDGSDRMVILDWATEPVLISSGGPEGLSFSKNGDLFFNTRHFPSGNLPHTGIWKLPGANPSTTPVKVVNAYTVTNGAGEATAFLTTGSFEGNIIAADPNTSSGRVVVRAPPPFDTVQAAINNFLSGPVAPIGLAVSSTGDIFVSESDAGRIWRFAPDGSFQQTITIGKTMNKISFDSTGNLYVAATHDNLIIKVAPNLTQTVIATGIHGVNGIAICQSQQRLTLDVGLCVDGSDFIYLQDSRLWLVHRHHQLPGWHSGCSSSYAPSPVVECQASPSGVATDPCPGIVKVLDPSGTPISSTSWLPDWFTDQSLTKPYSPNIDGCAPVTGCMGFASAAFTISPSVTSFNSSSLQKIDGRSIVSLFQSPSESNGFTTIILLDDDQPNGSAWYEIKISFAGSTNVSSFVRYEVSPLFDLLNVQATGTLIVYLQVDGVTAAGSRIPVNGIPVILSSPLGQSSQSSGRTLGVDGIVKKSYDLSNFPGAAFSVAISGGTFMGTPISSTQDSLNYNLAKRTSNQLFGTTWSGEASLEANVEGEITNTFNVTNDGNSALAVDSFEEWKGGFGVDWNLFKASIGHIKATFGGSISAGILAGQEFSFNDLTEGTQSTLVQNLVSRWILSNAIISLSAEPSLQLVLESLRTMIDAQNFALGLGNYESLAAPGAYFKGSACAGISLGINSKSKSLDTPCPDLGMGLGFETQLKINSYGASRIGYEAQTTFSISAEVDKSFFGIKNVASVGVEAIPIAFSVELVYQNDVLSSVDLEFSIRSTRDVIMALGYSGFVEPLNGLNLPNDQQGELTAIIQYSIPISILADQIRSSLSTLPPGDVGLGGLFGIYERVFDSFTNTPVGYRVIIQRGTPLSISLGLKVAGVGLEVGFEYQDVQQAIVDLGFLYKNQKWPVAQYSTIPPSLSPASFLVQNWLCSPSCPFSGTAIKKQEKSHELFLHVNDPEGHHVGLDYATNKTELRIPESFYYDNLNGTSWIVLPNGIEPYTISIDGTFAQQDLEQYDLGLVSVSNGTLIGRFDISASITQGTIHLYQVTSQAGLLRVKLAGTVNIDPATLNVGSKGKYVTAYIELPEGYDVKNVAVSSLRLNDTIGTASFAPVTVGDSNFNGTPDLMVKFLRTDVKGLFDRPGNYTLVVTGNVTSGGSTVAFASMDNIQVILQGDVNSDLQVSIADLAMIGLAYNSTPASANWNGRGDLNHDGRIDILDVAISAVNYGATF